MGALGVVYLYWAGWLAEITCFLTMVELVLVLAVIGILKEGSKK